MSYYNIIFMSCIFFVLARLGKKTKKALCLSPIEIRKRIFMSGIFVLARLGKEMKK